MTTYTNETASSTTTGTGTTGTAKDEALNVAGTAAEQARNVVGDAKQQVTAQVSDQATTQRDRLSQTLRTFGDDLQQMVEQGPDVGLASDLAREVSDRARSLGRHLEDREPGQLLDEARDFARRRPGTFLLGALAAGVVAGRLFRATADGAAAAGLAGTPGSTYPAPTAGTGTGVSAGPLDTPATSTTAPGYTDTGYTAVQPTLADPGPLTDPSPSAFPGERTQDTP